ncbi:MAG: acetylxylan esterase [Planctomycetes bacterium]|nr:acetylxylan esterase [Planctomycetota bacterium]
MYQASEHYAALYRNLCPRFSWRDGADFPVWRQGLHAALVEALGLSAMAQDLAEHQPRAEHIDTETCDGFVRERWILWVEPTVPLPFYLLKPPGAGDRPLPLVLTPHGHNHPHIYAGVTTSEDERQSMQEGQRDIAVQAAREGYLAIAPTTRAFGATRTEADLAENRLSSCRIALLHGLLVGRTAIGERVWDMQRLLDWALTALSVDARRVAITGNSGGGTVSLYAAAVEPRFTVTAPSCYFCTFAGSIGSINHCDCNYVPGIMRLGEMADIAGLCAPRPFRVIAGLKDEIFPIAEVRRSFAHLQRIYDGAGVPDACSLFEGEGGHRYYSAGAWPFIRSAFAAMG